MNNMQKAFKRKGLADGGRVNPRMLGTGTAAGAGIALVRRPQQIESAISAAEGAAPVAAAPLAAPAGAGGMSGIRDGATPPRGLMLAQRRGMADGGEPKRKPNGGLVQGPGGPTDDEAGLFDLSNKEYVLPADTVDAMGGPEVLDQVRDATHEFVDEENRGLVNGGAVWEKAKGMAGSAWSAGKSMVGGLRAGQPAAPAQPTPAGPAGDWSRQQKIDMQRAANGMKPSVTPNLPSTQVISPAQRTLGKVASFAKGIGSKLVAPLAAGSAVLDSAAEDSTARYAQRFGVSEPTGDGSTGDVLKFAGLRAGGFATDLANNLTLGAAGNLYRDKTGENTAQTALPQGQGQGQTERAPYVPGAGLPSAEQVAADKARANAAQEKLGLGAQLKGGIYDAGNADIFATSNRADGKLNSFSGTGDPSRPTFEQRNPADVQAALERADKVKADVVTMAANYAAQGDRAGAYRLAAGDPAATAAVEQAFQQRGLRQAALNGNKQAAAILAQQGKDAADIQVANITAGGVERVGLAKARSDMAKAQADLLKDERTQRNADRTFGLQERTLGNAEGQQNQKNIQNALEGVLGPRALEGGVPNPKYADFESKLNETLLEEARAEQEAAKNEKRAPRPTRTMADLHPTDLQDYLRKYDMYMQSQPGALGKVVNFLTGNDVDESNDLNKLAPRKDSGKKGSLYNTYVDERGQTRRVGGLAGDGLTIEQRSRVGLR